MVRYIQKIFMNFILYIMLHSIVMADPPDWVDDPGAFENTATIVGAIILLDGEPIASEGDRFAAFDDAGTVRGVAVQLSPPFGPYAGEIVYEMTIRSNAEGDKISFQYYDASEDIVFDIEETYSYSINAQIGDVIDPVFYNCLEEMFIDVDQVLQKFILEQNYPNPYNPETIIRYSVPHIADVTLEIFDIRGNLIAELISEMHRPGQYRILWNASGIAAGLYFIEMKAYSNNTQLIFKDINKMLYLK